MSHTPPFSPDSPRTGQGRAGGGPSSNTGHKYPTGPRLTRALIDWCTVIFPKDAIEVSGSPGIADFVLDTFAIRGKVAMSAVRDQRWQFYPRSAVLVDAQGNNCGKVGLAENGSVCVSLSGAGCGHVMDWHHVRALLEQVGAKLSRVDTAVDDMTGEVFQLRELEARAKAGDFAQGGRPPITSFVDDHGTGKGCTLYVGQKGHKQLCAYEKGKQLGDPESARVRVEVRHYAKHQVISLDVLTDPDRYFLGAYEVLAQYLVGELDRFEVDRATAQASGKALVRFLKNQCGQSFGLLLRAFGDDAMAFLIEHIARPGRPGRFRSIRGDLETLIRAELGPPSPGESHAHQVA